MRWSVAAVGLAFAAAGAGQPPPAPLAVEVSITPPAATVGDHVEATLTLRVPASTLAGAPQFPILGKQWGDAEVVAKGEPVHSTEGDQAVYRQTLVLAAFHPGRIPLPPLTVLVPERAGRQTASTATDLALVIRSVLPPGVKNPAPRPPALLHALAIGAAFWWSLAALAAAAIVGGLVLLQRRTAASAAAGFSHLAPLDELLATLAQLEKGGQFAAAPLHTELSLALRRYFGRSLALPAVESTTTELQRGLQLKKLPPLQVRRATEILRACDLVKFARQEVSQERSGERLAAARSLASEVETHLHPPAPAPEEGLKATG